MAVEGKPNVSNLLSAQFIANFVIGVGELLDDEMLFAAAGNIGLDRELIAIAACLDIMSKRIRPILEGTEKIPKGILGE